MTVEIKYDPLSLSSIIDARVRWWNSLSQDERRQAEERFQQTNQFPGLTLYRRIEGQVCWWNSLSPEECQREEGLYRRAAIQAANPPRSPQAEPSPRPKRRFSWKGALTVLFWMFVVRVLIALLARH